MPNIPPTGQDPWDADLNAFLLAQHNANGTHNIGLDDLSDVQVSSVAAGQEIVRNGANSLWLNISHKVRVQAYSGVVGNDSNDDSTGITNAINDVHSAGRGYIEFSDKTYRAKNLPIFSDIVYDLNGARITLPNSAGSGADVFRGNNFNTLLGTANMSSAIYNFQIRNGRINGNRANNSSGRHGLAIHGASFILENLMIYGCNGSGIWSEWGTTGSGIPWVDGIAEGDCGMCATDIVLYDNR